MSIQSINPYNQQIVALYEEMSVTQCETLIVKQHQGFLLWSKWSFAQRALILKKIAKELRSQKEELAKLMAVEMGKLLREGRGEIEKSAWVCDYYAENTEAILHDEIVPTEASKSMVAFQPLGVILAVMPWNYPFWQVFRFLAPALMAGNTAILKHASNVTGCALAIENIVQSALKEICLLSTIVLSGSKISNIIAHPLIKASTLTGSTSAGKAVGELSGKHLKKCVLELGGSDPYIVLEDANLDLAANICVQARLLNVGQTCIAAKRYIVIDKIYDEFMKLIIKLMSNQQLGDPLLDNTDFGPMARTDLRDELHELVLQSIAKGATLRLGGFIPELTGAFYPPTILENVKRGMPAYDDELFGPVASVIKVSSIAEAIDVANDTPFGLGAAIFSQNIKEAERIATFELQAGCCMVNKQVTSDPRLPFGGIKQSGYGRELASYGIKEFVNIKTVVIA